MAYAVIRYRYRKGRQAAYEPENKKLELWLTGLTTVGVPAMLALPVCMGEFRRSAERRGGVRGRGPAVELELSLPGKDGKLGIVDAGTSAIRIRLA